MFGVEACSVVNVKIFFGVLLSLWWWMWWWYRRWWCGCGEWRLCLLVVGVVDIVDIIAKVMGGEIDVAPCRTIVAMTSSSDNSSPGAKAT
jgi:hypothetical protein